MGVGAIAFCVRSDMNGVNRKVFLIMRGHLSQDTVHSNRTWNHEKLGSLEKKSGPKSANGK